MPNFGWLVPRKLERVSYRFKYNSYHKVKILKNIDSTWLKHLKTSVNHSRVIVRRLEMLRNSLQLGMGTLQSLQSNPTRTLRLDTTGLQQLDNDLTPRRGLELEELAQWHAAAKICFDKKLFFSDKNHPSMIRGELRTPQNPGHRS